MTKIRRNASCPCGSGRKYKHCHGAHFNQQHPSSKLPAAQIMQAVREKEATEKRRRNAQGHGRPIISADFKGHKIVAVGNTLHFAEKENWPSFSDFLMSYIITKLGGDWGNTEISKPFKERHPLLQWYHQLCQFREELAKENATDCYVELNGLIICYLGLAYNLYLLEHNAELQRRYIDRLKRQDLFQGAYYELIVASCMIRAGFKLGLEDETDKTEKHCEFSAVSKRTGKRYWIEAKARAVCGVLGKTELNGQSPRAKPTSKLTDHLKQALAKPASDDRIIFIDVNTGPMTTEDYTSNAPRVPEWMVDAERRLVASEKDLRQSERAYVFITNMWHHNALFENSRGNAFYTFGLGIDDYGKARESTFSDAWREKQKHIDIFAICDALKAYPQIPDGFDGELPPVLEVNRTRVRIGQEYNFQDIGVVGEVITARVAESDRRIDIVVRARDGRSHVLSEDISDDELQVYRANKDTYFGVIEPVDKKMRSPYELFEWLMESYKDTPREKLLEWMKDELDIGELKKLDQIDLALEYCERAAIAVN